MNKTLLLALLFITCNQVLHAQSQNKFTDNRSQSYQYFISLTGIHTRQEVENIQGLIAKKNGISFFMANRFPVRYFMMKATREISANEFRNWIQNTHYRLELFGSGAKSKEEAIILFNKNKAR